MIGPAVSAGDWRRIREICALTGKPGGEPVEEGLRAEFGELWIGPYEREARGLARGFLLREGGAIVGYLVAARDSERFLIRSGQDPAARSDRFFPQEARERIYREYPAHLHVNLIGNARGKGGGSALIEGLIADLREEGVRGVHCICGTAARGFYEKAGFSLLAETLAHGKVALFALGRRIV